MIWLISYLKTLLMTPSAFWNDPAQYRTNQVLHSLLVGAGGTQVAMIAGLLADAVLGDAVPPAGFVVTAGLIIVLHVGYLTWEFVQFNWYGAALSDCVEDYGHVATASFISLFGAWPVYLGQLVLIQSGYYLRKEVTNG